MTCAFRGCDNPDDCCLVGGCVNIRFWRDIEAAKRAEKERELVPTTAKNRRKQRAVR